MTAFDAVEEAVRRDSFLIVAMGRDRAIGSHGRIPWRHRADMRHFRDATLGCALVVGRTTFDSLPKAMPGREVVVVTSRPIPADAAAIAVGSVEEAVRIAIEDLGVRAVAFAGGPRVYEDALALPWMDRALVTEIGLETGGDAFMPRLGDGWRTRSVRPLPSVDGEPSALLREAVRRAIPA